MGSVARMAVTAGTASALAEAEATARAEALRRGQASGGDTPVPPAPALAQAEQLVAVLKELAALHAQGVLTDEELAAQKARLLA
jgi:hypothetical protein